MKIRNIFLFAVALSLLIVAFLAWREIFTSLPGEERVVTIPLGSSFNQTSSILKKNEVIPSIPLFRLFAEAKRATHQIQAGEYRLDTGMSWNTLLEKLVKGDVIRYPLTIPEGFTLSQIAQRLEALEICGASSFREATGNPELLSKLKIQAKSAEGFLYPETYNFPKNTPPEKVVETMVNQFWKVFDAQLKGEAQRLGWTPLQVVTLASLIEKEATLQEEGFLISAVFHNRLRIKMPLQSDPTVLYGLGIDSGAPTKAQLQTPSPYNTYLHRALPPGPISNPGRDSIEAALRPAAVPYLYFVSRNNGSHAFSATLQEHNRYVNLYQR